MAEEQVLKEEIVFPGVLLVTFTRPKRKNAFSLKMIKEFTTTLQNAAANDSVRVVLITGEGDFFSSGNDLGNFNEFSGILLNNGLFLISY